MEHKLEYTFISFRMGVHVDLIKYPDKLGYNRRDRTLCRQIYPLVYTRKDARGYFSCCLGIIEKSLRTFKMKASFVEENVPGQCNWDGTLHLFCFPSDNTLRKTCLQKD